MNMRDLFRKIEQGSIFIIILAFIFGCDLWMLGSERTGYRVIIETAQIDYNSVQKIEKVIIGRDYQYIYNDAENGVKEKWRERKIDLVGARYADEVQTGFIKIFFVNDQQERVDVYMRYVKETNLDALHLMIEIENWWRGGIVPELKTEIDKTANVVSALLYSQVGRNEVTILRQGDISKK